MYVSHDPCVSFLHFVILPLSFAIDTAVHVFTRISFSSISSFFGFHLQSVRLFVLTSPSPGFVYFSICSLRCGSDVFMKPFITKKKSTNPALDISPLHRHNTFFPPFLGYHFDRFIAIGFRQSFLCVIIII